MSVEMSLRVYLDPDEIGADGYPYQWHRGSTALAHDAIKDTVRAIAGHRCERCHHPYLEGVGEWSPCDEQCAHGGPTRYRLFRDPSMGVEAQWRILTVHHLNGIKHDCRWWNLAALCQRCHLTVQARVVMERPWPWEHSDWFQLHAAGWYACRYLGVDLTRAETETRMDELLEIGRQEEAVERMPL